MPIRDYSQTAGSNTTISSINIAEGCPPSNINDAIRQALADVRELQAGSTIASAATCNIGAANAEYLAVSGTTAITAFDSVAAGVYRVLKFDGALTLTHNATSLILPSGASITTAANDVGGFRSLGSGNWRCEWYSRASGAALIGASAASESAQGVIEIATQAEADAGTDDARAVTPLKLATISPASVTLASGDQFLILDASDSNKLKRSTVLVGNVLQQVSASSSAYVSGTTTTPVDDTIPQQTEGNELLTVTITPKAATSTLLVEVNANCSSSAAGTMTSAIFRDSTANAIAAQGQYLATNELFVSVVRVFVAASSTSATTFKLRVGCNNAATVALNGVSGARLYGGVSMSTITVTEIAA